MVAFGSTSLEAIPF